MWRRICLRDSNAPRRTNSSSRTRRTSTRKGNNKAEEATGEGFSSGSVPAACWGNWRVGARAHTWKRNNKHSFLTLHLICFAVGVLIDFLLCGFVCILFFFLVFVWLLLVDRDALVAVAVMHGCARVSPDASRRRVESSAPGDQARIRRACNGTRRGGAQMDRGNDCAILC